MQLYAPSFQFTFHYVSIKSFVPCHAVTVSNSFTFHYVSIKSGSYLNNSDTVSIFTFHYVSIKSEPRAATERESKIYIPLCIY